MNPYVFDIRVNFQLKAILLNKSNESLWDLNTEKYVSADEIRQNMMVDIREL